MLTTAIDQTLICFIIIGQWAWQVTAPWWLRVSTLRPGGPQKAVCFVNCAVISDCDCHHWHTCDKCRCSLQSPSYQAGWHSDDIHMSEADYHWVTSSSWVPLHSKWDIGFGSVLKRVLKPLKVFLHSILWALSWGFNVCSKHHVLCITCTIAGGFWRPTLFCSNIDTFIQL